MPDLWRFVRDLLEKKGIGLTEEEVGRVVADLKRWTERSVHPGMVRTADGSYTLISSFYGEPYHSISAGAVSECLLKFLFPSRVLEKVLLKGEVRILDIGFGLGYNTAVALAEIRKVSPEAKVEVFALDLEVPDDIPPMPEPYRSIHEDLIRSLPIYESENVRVNLILGDARKTIVKLAGIGADAVFHDPFSPFKNPELWTLDFLKLIREAIAPDGIWVSYTSALPVRRALLDLGFKVGETRPVGRKRGGTVASLKGDVPPLPPEEEDRLRASPYSVPFRDPALDRDRLRILTEYRITVLLREKETS